MSYLENKTKIWKNECIEIWNNIQFLLKAEKFSTISGLSRSLDIPRNLVQGVVKALVGVGLLDVKITNSVIVSLTNEGEKLVITPITEKE